MREKGTGTIVMSNGRAQLLFKKTTGRTATITIKCKDGTTCGDKEEALKLVNEAFGELVSKTNGMFVSVSPYSTSTHLEPASEAFLLIVVSVGALAFTVGLVV